MKKFGISHLQSSNVGLNSHLFPPVGILRLAVSPTAPRGLRSTGFFMSTLGKFG